MNNLKLFLFLFLLKQFFSIELNGIIVGDPAHRDKKLVLEIIFTLYMRLITE